MAINRSDVEKVLKANSGRQPEGFEVQYSEKKVTYTKIEQINFDKAQRVVVVFPKGSGKRIMVDDGKYTTKDRTVVKKTSTLGSAPGLQSMKRKASGWVRIDEDLFTKEVNGHKYEFYERIPGVWNLRLLNGPMGTENPWGDFSSPEETDAVIAARERRSTLREEEQANVQEEQEELDLPPWQQVSLLAKDVLKSPKDIVLLQKYYLMYLQGWVKDGIIDKSLMRKLNTHNKGIGGLNGNEASSRKLMSQGFQMVADYLKKKESARNGSALIPRSLIRAAVKKALSKRGSTVSYTKSEASHLREALESKLGAGYRSSPLYQKVLNNETDFTEGEIKTIRAALETEYGNGYASMPLYKKFKGG